MRTKANKDKREKERENGLVEFVDQASHKKTYTILHKQKLEQTSQRTKQEQTECYELIITTKQCKVTTTSMKTITPTK